MIIIEVRDVFLCKRMRAGTRTHTLYGVSVSLIYINLVNEEIVSELKTSFLLKCIQLLGICALKVTNVQLNRKEEETLGFKYFIFIKIFDIFRLLTSLQGYEYTIHCTYFYERFFLVSWHTSFHWTDLGVLIEMMVTASIHFVSPRHPFIALSVSANLSGQKPCEEGIIIHFTEEKMGSWL